jgi:DNA-binding response OmpR family regulator
VEQDGAPLDLTDVEFSLLEALIRSPGKVIEREPLVKQVLGRKFGPFNRSFGMRVSRPRQKLSGSDERIKTVWRRVSTRPTSHPNGWYNVKMRGLFLKIFAIF